jgi:hAT family C-terminal dimerisation region
MVNFHVIAGLHIAKFVFTASDKAATSLQNKDIIASEASAVSSSLHSHLERLRESFGYFWNDVNAFANENDVEVSMPRQRKKAAKLAGDTKTQHTFSLEGNCRQQYSAVIDSIISQLNERFQQSTLTKLAAIEKLLVNAAKGDYSTDSATQETFILYGGFLHLSRLHEQLPMLKNVIQTIRDVTNGPTAKYCQQNKITSVRGLADTSAQSQFGQTLFSEVFRLCVIYMTVPMTSATAERSFSTLRRIKTYLRQTMSQCNACMVLNIHKDRADVLAIKDIAKSFVNTCPNACYTLVAVTRLHRASSMDVAPMHGHS